MQEDYWHWRLQAAARLEVLRMAQALGRSASFSVSQVLGSSAFIQVLEQLSVPPLSESLNQAIQKLATLEADHIPPELLALEEQVVPASRLRRLAELSVQLFSLAVAAVERREELLKGLQAEMGQLTLHLEEARERQSLEVFHEEPAPAPQVMDQLPALTGLFGQQLEWAQSQLRHQEQRLDEVQKQARTLEFSLLDKQNELRFAEHKNTTQKRSLRSLKQRSERLRHTTRELRAQNNQLLAEREQARLAREALERQLQSLPQGGGLEELRRLQFELDRQREVSAELLARLGRFEQIERENQQLEVQLAESMGRAGLLEQKLDKAIRVIQATREQSQQELSLRERKLEDLSQELARRDHQLEESGQQAALKAQEFERLERQLAEAQHDLARRDQQANELRQQLEDADLNLQQSNSWKVEFERRWNQLEQDHQQQLEQARAEAEVLLAKKEQQLVALRLQLEREQAEASEIHSRLFLLQQELAESRERTARFETGLEDSESERVNLGLELMERTQEFEEQKQLLQERSDELLKAQQQQALLMEKLQQTVHKARELKAQALAAQAELRQLKEP